MDEQFISLDDVRRLVPHSRLSHQEALVVAEMQAMKLLRLGGITKPPVPVHALAKRAGVDLSYHRAVDELGVAASGGDRWHIWHPHRDQADFQATVAHQLKLIIDHPFGDDLYPHQDVMAPQLRRHHAAEYFAACLTLPQEWIEQMWATGERDVASLARQFGVSVHTMRFRLQALGLYAEALTSVVSGPTLPVSSPMPAPFTLCNWFKSRSRKHPRTP